MTKRIIGLACLVLAIFLTPDACDFVAHADSHAQGWLSQAILRFAPAVIAWMIGLWIIGTRSKPDV